MSSALRSSANRASSSIMVAKSSAFLAARASTFSSMVSSAMKRCTFTERVCPMRCVRSTAWDSAAGFHQGSSTKTVSASVRVSPKPPALSEMRNAGAVPVRKRSMTCGRFRVDPSRYS